MSQNVQLSNIICDNPRCEHNQQRVWGNFYKCLNCTDINNHSKYYCNDCKISHDKEHTLVKYNEKDFYCEEKNHYQQFSHFCHTCYKDLCEKCLKYHKNHKISNYDSFGLKRSRKFGIINCDKDWIIKSNKEIYFPSYITQGSYYINILNKYIYNY